MEKRIEKVIFINLYNFIKLHIIKTDRDQNFKLHVGFLQCFEDAHKCSLYQVNLINTCMLNIVLVVSSLYKNLCNC